MAKADLTLPDGTTVSIDGTAEEVALLLQKFTAPGTDGPRIGRRRVTRARTTGKQQSVTKTVRKGPQQLVKDLAAEDWFKTKRTIGDLQKKLEEKGHIYAMESLSTPLLRLTRSKVLRRIKDKNGWVYVS